MPKKEDKLCIFNILYL